MGRESDRGAYPESDSNWVPLTHAGWNLVTVLR